GRDIGRGAIAAAIALYDDPERVGAARLAIPSRRRGVIRPQIVLIADRFRHRVDHTDRVVVVVDDYQGLAVGGDAQTAGVGLDPQPDALIVAQGDLRPRRDEGASALVVDIDGVVVPARGIKRVSVRREDEANMGVRLADHLGERGLGLVGAGHVGTG